MMFIVLIFLLLSTFSLQREIIDNSLRLFVIGDIGGIPVLDTTFAQRRVAKSLKERAKLKRANGVINLGDNFYFTGVMDVEDERFKTRFEEPYGDLSLPWYTIAGNHDHFGSVQAQIEYSKKSRWWVFPSSYYKKSFSTQDTTVDLLMLDTIDLCGNTADVKSGEFVDWLKKGLVGEAGLQPDHPHDQHKADEQWKWLETQLQQSTADYIVVGGHYPVLSIASHGPTNCLLSRLHPLLNKYSVTFYMAGHDHSLQHILHDNVTYLVSGAGSRSDTSEKYKTNVLREGAQVKFSYPRPSIFLKIFSQLGFSDGGFVEMTFTKDAAEVLFLNKDGHIVHSTRSRPLRWNGKEEEDKSIELEAAERAARRAEAF